MKNYTESQVAIIAQASEAIKAAALESITMVVVAKASLTIVIRDQVKRLEKGGIHPQDIALIVRENVAGAASASHISRTLTKEGIRLRGERTDAGFLRMADGALAIAMETKPAATKGGGGGGHTAETLAALLGSLDPELVSRALEIAGLA